LKKAKIAIFYCNASSKLGLGHLYRARTLAKSLKYHNFDNILFGPEKKFLLSSDKTIFKKFFHIRKNYSLNNTIKDLIQCADLYNSKILIVDDYKFQFSHQKILKKNNIKWLQYDLKGNKKIISDIILNYSPNAVNINYKKKINTKKIIKLFGTKFSILRNEFNEVKLKNISAYVRTLVLSFGAGNDKGATIKILKFLKQVKFRDKINIILPLNNPNCNLIKNWVSRNSNLKIKIYENPKKISNILIRADLAIISGGTIAYECASLGIPMLISAIADNQINTSKYWHNSSAGIYLGLIEKLDYKKFKAAFFDMTLNVELRKQFKKNALKICDGKGSNRVAAIINQFVI